MCVHVCVPLCVYVCSLPLKKKKRELLLRLLRHQTNNIGLCHSGGLQNVGSWKVEYVPLEKNGFLVQQGLGRRTPQV